MRRAAARASALAGVALSVGLGGCGSGTPHPGARLPGPHAALAQARANAVTVSPLPGTPDASPRTQISFLGPRGTKVLDVHAVGSTTGLHAGRIEPYSTGTGASFLPKRSFKKGESVALEARVEVDGHVHSVGTIFHVEGRTPASAPPASPAASAAAGTTAGAPSAGTTAGAPSAGTTAGGHSTRALPPSADDYRLTPRDLRRGANGTGWIELAVPARVDQAPYGGARRGLLEDSAIEEIDLERGLVMWEWHALGHVPLPPSRLGTSPWIAYEIDSIEPRGRGEIVVSIGDPAKRYAVEIRSGATSELPARGE